MEITNAQYHTDDNGNNTCINCTIDGTNWSVPLDSNNSHYQAILEWAEEDGNEIQAAE